MAGLSRRRIGPVQRLRRRVPRVGNGCASPERGRMLTRPALDPDPEETQEWLDALDGVLTREGPARTRQLVERLVERAQTGGAHVSLGVQTPYINTIPPSQQPRMPGNDELET